jgi:ABC-type phosphate/phosphonate transport system substrate-binding protein
LPRHLVSVRKDLAPVLVKQVKKVLLSMHQNPEGQRILQKTDGTTKFDALPGGEWRYANDCSMSFYSPEKK